MSQAHRISMFLCLMLVIGHAAPSGAAPANESKSIDVVLCLDVSGSMEGLIEVAKVRLWDIVNELARAKPIPKLRVALYSYGHSTYSPKEGWVRKEMNLTEDLDAVYQKLNALTINGGEEYVARVSHAALTQQPWASGKDALRLIFVCGNEPADQDPEVSLSIVSGLAKEKSVLINTIYCNWGRAKPNERDGWKRLAEDAGGQFAVIEYERRLHMIETPFDAELNQLNGLLNETFVGYGSRGGERKENQLRQDANAQSAGAQAFAGRVNTKANALYRSADWCIVSRAIEDPKFDVNQLPPADLPEELRPLKPEERVEWIKKKVAQRQEVQQKINELSTRRAQFVDEAIRKEASIAQKQFDVALRQMIRQQCATRGIEIPEKP